MIEEILLLPQNQYEKLHLLQKKDGFQRMIDMNILLQELNELMLK
jgi:hypothetical protein